MTHLFAIVADTASRLAEASLRLGTVAINVPQGNATLQVTQ